MSADGEPFSPGPAALAFAVHIFTACGAALALLALLAATNRDWPVMFLLLGLALIVDCGSLEEPVYVDREMWEKVVLNLLSNAFKYADA